MLSSPPSFLCLSQESSVPKSLGTENCGSFVVALHLRSAHSRLCRSPPHPAAATFSPLGSRGMPQRLSPSHPAEVRETTLDYGLLPLLPSGEKVARRVG